jgi:phage shock protein PspC (stress-responsive transcriptional regulator)
MSASHPRRLHRSRTDRRLAGVCGGLGACFGIDPIILRIVWVLLTIGTIGMGILAYVIFWLAVPEEA